MNRFQFITSKIRNQWYKLIPPPEIPDNPRASDVYFVDWFRSGNIWLRAIFYKLITKKDIDFDNLQEILPDIHVSKHLPDTNFYPFPRIIKSHSPYNKHYHRVVYLVRNPRSSIISFYFYFKEGRGKDVGSISQFLRGENGIISWCQHVRGWKNKYQVLIKFEDLKKNTKKEVTKILDFLDINLTDQEIDAAISSASFKHLKELEQKSKIWKNQHKFQANFSSLRKGSVYEWRTILNKEDLNFINQQLIKYKIYEWIR